MGNLIKLFLAGAWNEKEKEDLNNLMFGAVEEQFKSRCKQIDDDIDFI